MAGQGLTWLAWLHDLLAICVHSLTWLTGWLAMVVYYWPWLTMERGGWICLNMVGHGNEWLAMAGYCWTWLTCWSCAIWCLKWLTSCMAMDVYYITGLTGWHSGWLALGETNSQLLPNAPFMTVRAGCCINWIYACLNSTSYIVKRINTTDIDFVLPATEVPKLSNIRDLKHTPTLVFS